VSEAEKNDAFYHPTSKPDLKVKPTRNRTLERGYKLSINDPELSIPLRLEALARLPNPSARFLAGLVRKADTPARLRFEATRRLEAIQTAATDLLQAELDAQTVLDGIRARQRAAEQNDSVFGGLDE
jgi:hypothetical protein